MEEVRLKLGASFTMITYVVGQVLMIEEPIRESITWWSSNISFWIASIVGIATLCHYLKKWRQEDKAKTSDLKQANKKVSNITIKKRKLKQTYEKGKINKENE